MLVNLQLQTGAKKVASRTPDAVGLRIFMRGRKRVSRPHTHMIFQLPVSAHVKAGTGEEKAVLFCKLHLRHQKSRGIGASGRIRDDMIASRRLHHKQINERERANACFQLSEANLPGRWLPILCFVVCMCSIHPHPPTTPERPLSAPAP